MTAEDVKRSSDHLRGALAHELAEDSESFAADGSDVLLKFHGIYQQDDRDVRRERAAKKLPLAYSCMVRTAVPGGELSAEQWLALDRLADVADGTMRLTTRQGVQFHFVHKGSLRKLVNGINAAAMSTLAACGDVVRNIMACPWPDDRQAVLRPLVGALVRRFKPRTSAYWELWVDGEKAVTAEPPFLGTAGGDDVEPVYGDIYLPRKFKISVAWPGDNCVDVLAHDIGIVPTLSDGLTGDVIGYNLFVGGGLGQSHARPDDTYPRLGSALGWVTPERVVDAAEAIVTTQRDFGNREDRQRARLKYLVDERGIDWIRSEVERRLGGRLADPSPLPEWVADEHHGRRDGVIGLPVPSGKIVDRSGVDLRTVLRELTADGTVTHVRITPRQDVLLCGIAPNRLDEVEQRLRDHGVPLAGDVSALRRLAIACPALPTCGQALGEAERVLPSLVDELEKAMSDGGLGDAPIRVNMTGCPNGCARPYTAEIGIVGRTKKNYDIYVGGSPTFDRLATLIRADVPLDQVASTIAPLFDQYAASGTSFGDWANDVGRETIETWLPEPVVRRRGAARAEAHR
ncbi:MAG: NADPH-dependent assimilatory sulfite reductase hemoprotein subunit [Acidimicrobiales bacterium]